MVLVTSSTVSVWSSHSWSHGAEEIIVVLFIVHFILYIYCMERFERGYVSKILLYYIQAEVLKYVLFSNLFPELLPSANRKIKKRD